MNSNHDHTITERSRRFRARRKAARLEAARLAKIAHRQALDAARVAKGLPPALTSTARAQRTRQRQREAAEQVRTESWYSLPPDYFESLKYLQGVHPDASPQDIDRVVTKIRAEAPRYSLYPNRFCLMYGIEEARLRRAILEQVLEKSFGGDCSHLAQAMKIAVTKTDIELEPNNHPTVAYRFRQNLDAAAQCKWHEGQLCLLKESQR